jgi:hypothetical protein
MSSLKRSGSTDRFLGPTTAIGQASLLLLLFLTQPQYLSGIDNCEEKATAQIRLESPHPWRPPFGLERVGQPLTALAEVTTEERPYREYWIAAYAQGTEVDRQMFHLSGHFLTGKAPYTGKATLTAYPDELVLFAKCRFQGAAVEVARYKVPPAQFEAEAIARPDSVIHPVDLGTILPPNDWLLLRSDQKGSVELAAISRSSDIPGARASVWFASAPSNQVTAPLSLQRNRRLQLKLALPTVPVTQDRDVLHVTVSAGEHQEIWHKQIQTMIVTKPPKWPEFGATLTKLRYDAPISVRDPRTGALSSMNYDTAWPAHLEDVVVSLPGGSRYVFWRGSCYIPFWAGKHNTGMSYEWAETTPPPDGFTDSVEPLMDKELRFSRVEIVESTPSRVHVRWVYQSTDFTYKVWGDSPVEDYYFYPDGFGTRVLSLTSAPAAKYEVQEIIILAPQAAFPYQVLNPKMVDILFIDGLKREIVFPPEGTPGSSPGSFSRPGVGEARDLPAVYSVRLHKDDVETAISFNPIDTHLPHYLFSPFYDRGVMVTPAYWGSHWPLARGNTTGWNIDDRIYSTPSHNSVLSWGLDNQTPLHSATLPSIDTLGQAKTMTAQRYVWLIGMTDAPDSRILEWAHSFKTPPSLELKGARLEPQAAYVSERRAIRLIIESPDVTIVLKPTVRCVNPVFELRGAPKILGSVKLGGRVLGAKEYAWDGSTLWIRANVDAVTPLTLEFAKSS